MLARGITQRAEPCRINCSKNARTIQTAHPQSVLAERIAASTLSGRHTPLLQLYLPRFLTKAIPLWQDSPCFSASPSNPLAYHFWPAYGPSHAIANTDAHDTLPHAQDDKTNGILTDISQRSRFFRVWRLFRSPGSNRSPSLLQSGCF